MKAKLTFEEDLNSSVQVGDNVWYVNTTNVGNYDTASVKNNDFVLLGTIVSISSPLRKPVLEIDIAGFDTPDDLGFVLDETTFIMFSKNNQVNSSALKGYYAELNFVNNSNKKIELFAVSSEINQTSK
tara:strand:+ start:700 stop:1083 length:384 start_codon:yes stop_codon:yes gene_type:complete